MVVALFLVTTPIYGVIVGIAYGNSPDGVLTGDALFVGDVGWELWELVYRVLDDDQHEERGRNSSSAHDGQCGARLDANQALFAI